ncbi:hypothetical protein MRX96_012042 [Rhipicephalus microplus]
MRGYCTSSLWSLLLLLLDACCLLTTPVSARLEEVPKFNARDACHGGTNIATRQGYLFGPSYADAEIKQLTAGAGLHRCSWTLDTNSSAKVVRLLTFPAELTTSAGALHLELEFRAIHVGEGFMFYFEHAYRPVECAAELVSCRNGYRCASTEQLCDGHDDCGDGTDEEECPVSAVNGTTVFQPAVAPSDTDRIVGGTEASMDRWPWIAQLRTPRDEPNGYRCTATLIASKWLVSAAHCFKISLKPDRWVVNLRRHGIILQEDETVVRYVHRIIIHPGYNGFKPWNHTTPWLWRKEHDLALIELNAPVLESESVQPVCLPVDTDYWPAKGTLCRVAGWGVTLDPTQSRHFLREVALPVVDRKQCQAWFADREIGQTQLCAGYERGARDACTGDSGGPLVTRNGSQWILVGVVSTGVGCAKPRQAGYLHGRGSVPVLD